MFGLTLVLAARFLHSPALALVVLGGIGVATLPGYPMARRWFRGYQAWLVGAALGYLSTALAASALYRFELLSTASLGTGSLLLFVAARRWARFIPEGRQAGDHEPSDLFWLAAVWLLTLAVIAVPFSKVGAPVPGGIAFRAYFSADLMAHLSVVAELQKGDFPPVNPFYAGEALGYYWLFFTVPAVLGEWSPNLGALLTVDLAGGLLFSGLLFAAIRASGLRASRAFLAAGVAITAASYEGILALAREEAWTQVNVDALARWVWELISLDGLARSLLYTPQHLFSYSLLLVLLLMVIRGEPRGLASSVLSGCLLGGMAGSSIVTAMLAGPWLVLVLWWRRETARRFVLDAGTTTASALVFLGWFFAVGFFGEAGTALTASAPHPAEIFPVLFVDCGALVALALLRLVRRRRLSATDRELLVLAALALAAVLVLDLRAYQGVWMAWRAGSVLLVSLALFAAPALGGRLGWHQALILLPALPTVVLDVYNAQDLTNRGISPGDFRWTTVVREDEFEALTWLRVETPPEALVQWDVRAREPGEWALVPALAERRMAVGFPIFLLDVRKYRVRERREVRPIFVFDDPEEAHRLARRLGIDYLFIGRQEIRVRGERVRKFFEAPGLFRPVFENDEVTVLEVLPRPANAN